MRVVVFAVALPLRLRWLRLPELAAFAEPRAGGPSLPADLRRLVERIDAILAAAWPLVRRGCLVRGLTLYRFLRLAGAPVILRFGVDELGNGHCWIEHEREPLGERRDPRGTFTTIWCIAPPGERA